MSLWILYQCPKCGHEVSGFAHPEKTLSADGVAERRTVTCLKCSTQTEVDIACRLASAAPPPRKKREKKPVKKDESPELPLEEKPKAPPA